MKDKRLHLYGADWCLKSTHLRNYLQSEWIEFDDFNVELDSDAAARVRSLYNGNLKFPTLTYGDEFLKNPSISVLKEFLEKHNLKD